MSPLETPPIRPTPDPLTMSANTQVKAKTMLCGEDDSPADVILRIDKDKADLIVAGRKNHDFRYFLLDEEVKRIWLYINQDKAVP